MYLPDDLHRYLAREARGRGVSMAEIAREAIAQYRQAHEEDRRSEVSPLVGVFGVDVVDAGLSESVDVTLAEYFEPSGTWEQENGRADGTR